MEYSLHSIGKHPVKFHGNSFTKSWISHWNESYLQVNNSGLIVSIDIFLADRIMYNLRRCAPLLKNLSKQFPTKSLRCVVYLSTSVKPSVDTDWLNSEMKKANPNLLLLDTTWNRFVNGHELYLE